MLGRIQRFAVTSFKSIFAQDFMGLSAEMAFYTIFSFFPFLIFTVSLFKIFGSEYLIHRIISYFTPIIPSYVHGYIATRLNDILNFEYNGFLSFLTLFFSMIIASNAMFALIKGLNSAYHVKETRPLWFTRLLSVIFLFLMVFVIFIGTNVVVFGKMILDFIASIQILPQFTISLISVLRWPLMFFALYSVFLFIYYALPDVKGRKRAKFFAAMPGTFFFCFAWLVSSWLYGIYLNHINMYNMFFGAMGVLAIFLIWLYYTSLILLLVGEINSRFYEKLKDEKSPLKTVI